MASITVRSLLLLVLVFYGWISSQKADWKRFGKFSSLSLDSLFLARTSGAYSSFGDQYYDLDRLGQQAIVPQEGLRLRFAAPETTENLQRVQTTSQGQDRIPEALANGLDGGLIL